jgi:glucose-6-phosphate-specific signal transduction histidine kinase
LSSSSISNSWEACEVNKVYQLLLIRPRIHSREVAFSSQASLNFVLLICLWLQVLVLPSGALIASSNLEFWSPLCRSLLAISPLMITNIHEGALTLIPFRLLFVRWLQETSSSYLWCVWRAFCCVPACRSSRKKRYV